MMTLRGSRGEGKVIKIDVWMYGYMDVWMDGGNLTYLSHSRHTQTCQRCSHFHTESKVFPVNSREPAKQTKSECLN